MVSWSTLGLVSRGVVRHAKSVNRGKEDILGDLHTFLICILKFPSLPSSCPHFRGPQNVAHVWWLVGRAAIEGRGAKGEARDDPSNGIRRQGKSENRRGEKLKPGI